MVDARSFHAEWERRDALQRLAEINSRHLAKDAHRHLANAGSGRSCETDNLSRSAAKGGILAHAESADPDTSHQRTYRLGSGQHVRHRKAAWTDVEGMRTSHKVGIPIWLQH